ncbi:MAG: hypothetical protein D6759_06280 [Chloroflexi bacterium]|nr:MAG: hypothetical protein D6759_06280 [Chloroflexota bacterium]
MEEKVVTLEEVLTLARQLPARDQVRLIERLAPEIERALVVVQPPPRKSLRGLWRGLEITEEEIDQIRREMWQNFPREDI